MVKLGLGGVMELAADFSFQPLPAIQDAVQQLSAGASPLGPLAGFAGNWTGRGFNAPTQLQYAQTVLLNLNTLSWPHITVATLHKS